VSEIAREIASQPGCWREAVRMGVRLRQVLPAVGARVLVIGCGTSLFMAQAYAALREALGLGETDAFPASEAPRDRRYDVLVAISRSGTTTEVARFLADARDVRRVALVGVTGAPVPDAADDVVNLGFADERSVVQTRFATTALALLRSHLGQDLGPAIAQAEVAIDAPLPIEPSAHSHYVSLGRGWTVGLANEAALKLREAAQAWSEAYPAMEYRHGPISVAGPGSVVWALGDIGDAIRKDVAATGATLVGGDLDPMAELVRVQRVAAALADARGLDPDHPRNLTRSVVLS
jgi:fructoselysine-6-P-deglycase FrlB-like protein